MKCRTAELVPAPTIVSYAMASAPARRAASSSSTWTERSVLPSTRTGTAAAKAALVARSATRMRSISISSLGRRTASSAIRRSALSAGSQPHLELAGGRRPQTSHRPLAPGAEPHGQLAERHAAGLAADRA